MLLAFTTPAAHRTAAWTLLAPVAIMTLATFLAFVLMAIGQAATGGLPFFAFGDLYHAPFVRFLWWVAFAITALGMLGFLSAKLQEEA